MKRWMAGAVLLNAFILADLIAQPQHGEAEGKSFVELSGEAYGLDQSLVNGYQYVNRYAGCLGQPYFLEDQFYTGEVLVGDRIFSGRQLRYDLVTQQLELLYQRNSGVTNRLVMIPDHIQAFSIGNYRFRRLDLDERGSRFYQVVPTGQFICYLHWEKSLVPVNGDIRYVEECTDPVITYLLEKDGERFPFTSKRSLAALFPAERQKEIRRLLRQSQFQPRKAGPDTIIGIMRSISDILEAGVEQ
jgi:hypothetical protein